MVAKIEDLIATYITQIREMQNSGVSNADIADWLTRQPGTDNAEFYKVLIKAMLDSL